MGCTSPCTGLSTASPQPRPFQLPEVSSQKKFWAFCHPSSVLPWAGVRGRMPDVSVWLILWETERGVAFWGKSPWVRAFFFSFFPFFFFFSLFFKWNLAMQNRLHQFVREGRHCKSPQCLPFAQKPESLMLWLGGVAFRGYKSSFWAKRSNMKENAVVSQKVLSLLKGWNNIILIKCLAAVGCHKEAGMHMDQNRFEPALQNQ